MKNVAFSFLIIICNSAINIVDDAMIEKGIFSPSTRHKSVVSDISVVDVKEKGLTSLFIIYPLSVVTIVVVSVVSFGTKQYAPVCLIRPSCLGWNPLPLPHPHLATDPPRTASWLSLNSCK